MTSEWVGNNWALVAASILATAIFLFVLYRAWEASARGRLGRALRQRDNRALDLKKCVRNAKRLERRLAALGDRIGSVKPRDLRECQEQHEDALALAKIAHDQYLIAQNQVRKIIVDEFPPNRQQKMRERCKVDEPSDSKPFTF